MEGGGGGGGGGAVVINDWCIMHVTSFRLIYRNTMSVEIAFFFAHGCQTWFAEFPENEC